MSDFQHDKYLAVYAIGKFGRRACCNGDALAPLGKYREGVLRELPKTVMPLFPEKRQELSELGEKYFNNILNHGAPTWYEWRIEHWGSKWDAYCQNRVSDDTLTFCTAWSGVPEFMRKLSARYSDVGLSYKFADEDFGNSVGEYEFERGETLYENTPSGGSPTALRITNMVLELSVDNAAEGKEELADELDEDLDDEAEADEYDGGLDEGDGDEM